MAGSWKRRWGWTVFCVTSFVILYYVTGGEAQCVVSDINPVTRNGNTADRDSKITWGALPTKSFLSSGTYDDGGLGPYFNLAQSFVNSSLPNALPIAIIDGLIDGSYDIANEYSKIINLSLGYIVCIGLGFLFMIVFPIIGMCFCCCRCCCNNCGGKRVQKASNNNTCKRMTFSAIVVLHIIFITVGMICLFVSNSRMTVAIDNMASVYDGSISDADSYVKLLVDQTNHIGPDNFNFTSEVLIRDLRGIDVVLGVRVMHYIKLGAQLSTAVDDVMNLSSTVLSVSSTLNNISTGVSDVETAVSAVNSSLSTVRNDIQTTLTACSCGGSMNLNSLDTNFDSSTFPDISSQQNAINNTQQSQISSTVTSALEEVDNIPCRLKNESQSSVDSVISTLDNFANDGLNTLTDQVTTLSSGINISQYQGMADTYFTLARQYDTYRSYAGMGLAGLVLLITLLMFFGVLLGLCFSSVSHMPTDRSCLSNSGGNMLIASVILVFIFSWLLMLLTTLTYALGAPLERWVCQPVTDFNSPLYSELLDKPGGPLGEGYFIGGLIYGNSSKPITVSGILSDCRDGKTAYSALHLDNLFDIDSVLNYSNYIDIESTLAGLNMNMNLSITILTPELQTNLQDVKDAVNVNTSSFLTELDRSLTEVNLPGFAQSLRDLGEELVANNTGKPGEAAANATKNELYTHAASLDSIAANELQTLQTAVDSLKAQVNSLHTTKNTITTQVDNLNASLQYTEAYLNTNATDLITKEVNNYVQRLVRIVDSFVTYTGNAVKNEMGKCDIIYNLFADVVTVGICKYTLDAFNAIWLSLGWCIFFFVTGLVFTVKLSKHFRRMQFLEGGGTGKGSAKVFPSNKVGHMDGF